MLQESQAEIQDTELRQFSKKHRFIVPAQNQRTHVQRLSLENKGVSPYTPLQAGYRSKKQSSIHIWLHVTSLAISFPQGYVTFMFQFFKCYLCFAILSPCLIIRTQPVSLLVFLPATSFPPPPPLMLDLGSKSIILI
jgi:hypothetical protein